MNTHVWSEDLDPARFLLSSGVLKAEGHPLLVSVPALHLRPLKSDYLVLKKTQSSQEVSPVHWQECKCLAQHWFDLVMHDKYQAGYLLACYWEICIIGYLWVTMTVWLIIGSTLWSQTAFFKVGLWPAINMKQEERRSAVWWTHYVKLQHLLLVLYLHIL